VKRTLVAFASRHGSTEEVAVSIAAQLHAAGHHVELLPARRVRDLGDYDAIVLGGALYCGRWHRDARRLLKRYRRQHSGQPLAIFALGPRTLDGADLAASRAQLEAALAHAPGVAPLLVTVFGGVVDPARLRFPLNRMPACDALDRQAVSEWTGDLLRVLRRQWCRSRTVAA
jgi:menaquinone-dependent protoporphyrinogen oxidase